jgi:hypothetical protein
MLPLHDLAIGIRDSMAIAKLTLANKGPTTEFAVTFCPRTLTILKIENTYA